MSGTVTSQAIGLPLDHGPLLFFYQGKTPGGSKITKENYETCLEVNPTLAGRHQRNHHAAKPN